MTENPKRAKPDDLVQRVMTMREPPGRLGSIVRRLKQMQPVPPPIASGIATACSGERTE
jgi:hypothetical protein